MKNIVITGANRGIGRAIVQLCAENGANIFACMRTKVDEVEKSFCELAEEYNVQIYPIYFDMTDEQSIKNGATEILKYKMPIDGMVNNAGVVGKKNLFLMTSMNDIKDVFQANFLFPQPNRFQS